LVYCPKCGTKNEDDVKFCVQCGAPLYEKEVSKAKAEERCFGSKERREMETCFGLPYAGQIFGIVIGVLIIIWGLIWVLQQSGIIPRTVEIWPFAVMIVGILIIAGAIYGLRRR